MGHDVNIVFTSNKGVIDMTDLIYDFISTGVDLLLVGSVLAAMIVMMRGSVQLTTLISNQQIVTEEFDYYLQYHMYDNQDGLCSADALSAMVGNRYDLIVCINDTTHNEIYMNDLETGKYYKVPGTSENKTMSECHQMCLNAYAADTVNLLDYKQLAATDALSPENLFHANIMALEGGVLKKSNFSRDTIIVGLYFETMTP